MDERRCSKEGEIATLIETVKTIAHRMDKFEETQLAIYDLAKSVAVMAEKMTNISNDVKAVKKEVGEVKAELNNIKTEDSALWKKFKWHILTSVLTLLAAYLFKTVIGG